MVKLVMLKLSLLVLFSLAAAGATASIEAPHGEPRAYAQWIALDIDFRSLGTEALVVKNASVTWGKWYDFPDKDKELPSSSINGLVVQPNEILDNPIGACGRESSPSGTEGSFDMYKGATKVGYVYFSCPWSGSNKLSSESSCKDCVVSVPTVSSEGAIGRVTVKVAYLGSLSSGIEQVV